MSHAHPPIHSISPSITCQLYFYTWSHSELPLRITGVSSYDISLEKQEVIVKGTVPYDDVLEKIKKTGKEVRRTVHHVLKARCIDR